MKANINFKDKPSILVGTPVYYGSERFVDIIINSWRAFTYENMKFCIVENNIKSDSLHYKLANINLIKKPDDLFYYDLTNSDSESWKSLTQAQNKIRKVCIENKFDFLLMNEVTRPAPVNIIESLLRYNKRIIGVLYKDSYHPGYYCVYDFDYIEYTHLMERYLNIDKIVAPTKVYGFGFGTILIHRSILKTIEFRSEKYAADTYFFEDLYQKGIPVYVAPIIVENLKVDLDPVELRTWKKARQEMQKI